MDRAAAAAPPAPASTCSSMLPLACVLGRPAAHQLIKRCFNDLYAQLLAHPSPSSRNLPSTPATSATTCAAPSPAFAQATARCSCDAVTRFPPCASSDAADTHWCIICRDGSEGADGADNDEPQEQQQVATATLMPCGHRFHGECIKPWLELRSTCPLCRQVRGGTPAKLERGRWCSVSICVLRCAYNADNALCSSSCLCSRPATATCCAWATSICSLRAAD